MGSPQGNSYFKKKKLWGQRWGEPLPQNAHKQQKKNIPWGNARTPALQSDAVTPQKKKYPGVRCFTWGSMFRSWLSTAAHTKGRALRRGEAFAAIDNYKRSCPPTQIIFRWNPGWTRSLGSGIKYAGSGLPCNAKATSREQRWRAATDAVQQVNLTAANPTGLLMNEPGWHYLDPMSMPPSLTIIALNL